MGGQVESGQAKRSLGRTERKKKGDIMGGKSDGGERDRKKEIV